MFNTTNIIAEGVTGFNDLSLTEALNQLLAGMNDDLSFSISPTTVAATAGSTAWTRTVTVTLVDSDGDTQTWYNRAVTTGVSIADTSSAGTASITSTTLTFVNGVATVVVSGDAQAWLGGTAQVETKSVTGAPSGDGTITITVTAAAMDNSPKDVEVELVALTHTTTALTAAAIRAALTADEDVGGFFTVGGTDAAVVLTAKTPAANDATMDIGFTDTDTTSATMGATADTTAGVAKETDTLTIANETILGYTVTGGTSVETFS